MLSALFGVIVLDLIGFGMLMPILPFYAGAFGATPAEQGLLLSSYAVMQFACAPLWGKLSDRIGRKPVLLWTIGGSIVAVLVLAQAQNLTWLFIGRLLAGAFAANIGVASAYITDVTDESRRTGAMGLIGAAFGIGFALGPILGGVLGHINVTLPLYVIAGLSTLNLLQVWLRLREPERHVSSDHQSKQTLLRNPVVRQFVGLNFVYTFGITQLESTFVLYCMEQLRYTTKEASYVLGFTAVIMAIMQGGVIRRIRGDFDLPMLLAGTGVFGVAMVLLPSTIVLGWFLLLLTLSAIGRALSQPALLGMVSKSCNAGERGAVMGLFQSAASLARVFSPALAGWLFGQNHKVPFALAGVLVLLVGLAAMLFRARSVATA